MTENGLLRFSANPTFSYRWFNINLGADCSSEGGIGLYVGRYTFSGDFAGAPINLSIPLWHECGIDWRDDEGSNSGHPLSAQCSVDRNHWYALWVYCRGYIFAQGFPDLADPDHDPGSLAASYLSVVVPSMTWELVG